MTKQQELEQRLRQEFRPHFIAVENESYMHSSGRGADSHFKVVLVSDRPSSQNLPILSTGFAARHSCLGAPSLYVIRVEGLRATIPEITKLYRRGAIIYLFGIMREKCKN